MRCITSLPHRPVLKGRRAPKITVSAADRNGASRGADLQLQLWSALLTAAASSFSRVQQGAQGTAEGLQQRVNRILQPPPPGFPPGPTGEQSLELLASPLAYIDKTSGTWGEAAGLLLGGEYVVLITSPKYARQVLLEQPQVFVKEGTAFFPGSSLTGNGLLVSDGPTWLRQRRLSNPAFRQAAVERYSSCMLQATTDMLEGSWAQGGLRDVYEDYNALTLRITMEALFGFESTGPQSREVVSAIELAFEFFTNRAASGLLLPEWLPTWDNLQFGAVVQKLNRLVYSIISERRRLTAQNPDSVPKDLLQGLLTATDENGEGMTDEALRDELMTLLVAGQETSAILLAWASALLAHHPEEQERVAEEVDAILGGRAPTAADAQKLSAVENVILEALRLYPPAYMVGRCTSQDVDMGPFHLPKGTTVLVSPYALHRLPALWDSPSTFSPRRWTDLHGGKNPGYIAALKDMGATSAYIPFGAGQRICIGTGFAMLEVVLVIAMILQRYKLLPVRESGGESAFPQPKPLITLRPNSFRLRLVPRTSRSSPRADLKSEDNQVAALV